MDNFGPILTRCGFCCDLCLAYKPSIKNHPSNQQKLTDRISDYAQSPYLTGMNHWLDNTKFK